MTIRSQLFEEFVQEQDRLNAFFWSSELATQLTAQKLARKRKDRRYVHRIFSNIECNAFIKPANGRYPVKYMARIPEFEAHLASNLEFFAMQVIVNIHRAAERYVRLALQAAAEKSVQPDKPLFASIERSFRNHDVQLKRSIPLKTQLAAQIYAEVRNDIVHADDMLAVNVGSTVWSDADVYALCISERDNTNAKSRRVFPGWVKSSASKEAIESVCDETRRSAGRWPSEPLIFFYALFGLGTYRRLVEAINEVLP